MIDALVTGATSGVGEALARQLHREGATLLLVGRNGEKLTELASELGAATLQCDLGSGEERQRLVELIRTHPPDLMINCAGLGLYGNAIDQPVDKELEMLEVNSVALTELTLEAARALIQAGRQGTILNISSTLAFFPCPGGAVYGASKSYVSSFSQAIDYETRPHGVRVKTFCLGQTATDFFRRAMGRELLLDRGAISAEAAAAWILSKAKSKRSLHLIGGRYGWLTRLARLLPRRLVNKQIYGILARRS